MDLGKLGARIKSRREQRLLRQADIAAALRISAQAVSKWERGENAPDIAIVVELAHLLGVSVEWLLTGQQEERETFPAVVLCTSINGFADRAQRLPPHDVAAWANGIHYVVTEAILRFEGVPIKCLGDGLLAFFAGSQRAQRALAAARQATELFANPDLVIALHHGDIYLGTIGHPEYASLDVIGAAVNTAFLVNEWAARQALCRVAVTEEVATLLEESDSLVECGQPVLRGADAPVRVYHLQQP